MKYLILAALLLTTAQADWSGQDSSLYVSREPSFIYQPKTLTIQGSVGEGPLLTIDLKTGHVEASDSLSATEAGRVFVDYIRGSIYPCGSVDLK